MTVAQLIEQLQRMEPTALVGAYDPETMDIELVTGLLHDPQRVIIQTDEP